MRPWRWVLGLVLCGGAVAGAWTGVRWWYRTELAQAEREISLGRYGAAGRRLAGLARWFPASGEVAYPLGLCELALGRTDEAVAAWSRVPASSPMAAKAAVQSARLVLQRHRFAAAEDLLRPLLDQPTAEGQEARATLAHLWKIQGRYDEVLRLFRERPVDRAERFAVLRECWRLERDPYPIRELRQTLEQAARAAPDDDRIWLGRARLAIQSGAWDEADRWLTACEQRRERDPAVVRARLDWAVASAQPRAALSALEKIDPHALDARDSARLQAWFANQLHDSAGERRALEEYCERDPSQTSALERLAELALEAGQAAQALQIRKRKAEVDQWHARYAYLLSLTDATPSADELARLAESLGWSFEAKLWWSTVLDHDPQNLQAQRSLKALAAQPPQGPPSPFPLERLRTRIASATSPHVSKGSLPAGALHFTELRDAGLAFTYVSGRSPARQMPAAIGGGVGLLDYDSDGWLDVFVPQGGAFPPAGNASCGDRLFHNRGDGTFEIAPRALPANARGYGFGVAVGDYDNDGDPDLFLTRWRSYALYRNRGDGTFEDVTESAGLDGDRDWPTSAAWADLDNDGDLDLYVCHYLQWDADHPVICRHPRTGQPVCCSPVTLPPLPDHLFRNDGGRFVDVTAEAGVSESSGRGLGVVAFDADEDGRVDLFVANDMSANFLFHNRGGWRFEEIAVPAGVASNAEGGFQAGMGIACGDVDGDGRLDLAVTNFYGEGTSLFHSLGEGLFTDHSAAVGLTAATRYVLGFGASFLDADNDGRLDFLQVNGHVDDLRPGTPYAMTARIFRGRDGGRLVDVSSSAGAPFQAEHVARGLAVGDLNNDGRLDAVMVPQDEPLAYLHNETRGGHFLTLRLEGTKSNRDAAGARVSVTAGNQRFVAQCLGGGSYLSSSDRRLHFGLGSARQVGALTIRWPSGQVDEHHDLATDSGYLIREGDPQPHPLAGFPASH